MYNVLNRKNSSDISIVAGKEGLESIIYLVPHTHYDAIWVFNKEDYFRINIEFILKQAVDLMKVNPEYKFTIEQTYLLEEVEANYRSLFTDITKLIKEKRMEIAGGQYLMSDVMLPHGETLIREISKGKRYVKEKFDEDIVVGWGADEFGFNAQWPQILLGCGYRYFAFRRGADISKPSEFWWEGLDGSRVLCHWMPLGYRAGLDLTQLQKSYEELKKHAATIRHIFMPSGSGVTLPQPETPEIVEKWNATIDIKDGAPNGKSSMNTLSATTGTDTLTATGTSHKNAKKPKIRISTPSEYFSNLEKAQGNEEKVKFAIRTGEMYSGRLSEVFPDCTSSRMWIKQGVKAYENLLLTLERWHALGELELANSDVYDRLKSYWDNLLFMAMHDALPGTGIDEVYDEIRQILKSDFGPIKESIKYCLLHLISQFYNGDSYLELAVFNSLTWKVKNWVECVLEFDQGKIRGISHLEAIIPFAAVVDNQTNSSPKKNKGNIHRDENNIDIEIIECSPYPDGTIQTVKIGFIAEVPSLGYRVYRIVPGKNSYSERNLTHSTHFRNRSNFDIVIDPRNGLLNVSKNDKEYFKGNEILLEEELGDLYYHRDNLGLLKSETGEGVKYGTFKYESFNVLEGKLTYNIKLKSKYYALRWPYRLTNKLKPMLYRHNFVDIEKEIVVYKSLDRIDFVTHLYDRHPHSRIRVSFRTPYSSDDYWCGTQFGAIKRRANLFYKKNESGWVESPSGVFPSLDWIDYSSDRKSNIGVSILHQGIPSHEVRDNSIYLTLLRSIMVLSADGIMGPCVPTPNAAEMEPYTFRYSVLPHDEGWRESTTYRHAMEFNMSLIAIHLGEREPLQHVILGYESDKAKLHGYYHSFLEIEPKNVVLSTLKLDEHVADGDRSLVMRIYETEGKGENKVRLFFYKKIKSASIVDLLENQIQEIPTLETEAREKDYFKSEVFFNDNIIMMNIEAFKIVTLRVNF
jgi:alpha-mannosidase